MTGSCTHLHLDFASANIKREHAGRAARVPADGPELVAGVVDEGTIRGTDEACWLLHDDLHAAARAPVSKGGLDVQAAGVCSWSSLAGEPLPCALATQAAQASHGGMRGP